MRQTDANQHSEEFDSMTPDEAWKAITSDPMPARTRMLLTVMAVCVEDRSQYDAAEWCSQAAGDSPSLKDMPRIWARAVCVLRLPADVRRMAESN